MFSWNTWVRWCMGEPIDVCQALTQFEESSYLGLSVVCSFAPSRFILDYENVKAKWLVFSWNTWVRWCMGEPINLCQALTQFEELSYLGLRVVCPFAPSRFILDYKIFKAKWQVFSWNTWVRWCMEEPINVCQTLTVLEDSSYLGFRVVCPFAPYRFILDYKSL